MDTAVAMPMASGPIASRHLRCRITAAAKQSPACCEGKLLLFCPLGRGSCQKALIAFEAAEVARMAVSALKLARVSRRHNGASTALPTRSARPASAKLFQASAFAGSDGTASQAPTLVY